MTRFSDQELQEFHSEFVTYKQEVEELKTRVDAMQSTQIDINSKLDTVIENTSSIVELSRDIQGAARIGKSFQSFIFWLAKWGSIGVGIATVLQWILDNVVAKVWP